MIPTFGLKFQEWIQLHLMGENLQGSRFAGKKQTPGTKGRYISLENLLNLI
jgi:hypothetical protein